MDEARFEDLYRKTAPGLRSYLRASLDDEALADDLFQEAYVRLLRARLDGANVFQVRSYLYKTATTLMSDHGRALARVRRHREASNPEPPEPPAYALALDLPRVFRELPERQRTLLWMAYVEGFSHRDIAGALGLKERSVRVVLSRARRKLAEIMRSRGWDPMEDR